MISQLFLQELENSGISVKTDEPMSRHTTFKIGGNADAFVTPKNEDELRTVYAAAKRTETPVFLLGKGSNLLVSDNGIEGAVVSLADINSIQIDGECIRCGAGAALTSLCLEAQKHSLSGIEFAYGIPASVGGAMYMNAGAYGGEMSHAVESAVCMTRDGELVTVYAKDMALGYRTSIFKTNGMTVVYVNFRLKKGDGAEIRAKMDELMSRRRNKQPLEYPSAGSTFKRPEGYFAGALIENNGLKGESVGGAQVSVKHAGFVINTGNATCRDVEALIEVIKDKVYKADGVMLETEVIRVGR